MTDDLRDLTWLRCASIAEAITLIALLGVGVPMKHFFGQPLAVSLIGPAHGVAFLFFCRCLARVAAAFEWTFAEVTLALAAACLPFGGFFNERRFARKQAALAVVA